MDKLFFSQDNVNLKIKEIKSLPEEERKPITEEIKKDLRAWLLHNFEFPEFYEQRMALWPQSLREETGFGIASALFYDNWNLEILVPEPPTSPEGKSKHEQKVSGSGNSSGGYTVTKSHTWSW